MRVTRGETVLLELSESEALDVINQLLSLVRMTCYDTFQIRDDKSLPVVVVKLNERKRR